MVEPADDDKIKSSLTDVIDLSSSRLPDNRVTDDERIKFPTELDNAPCTSSTFSTKNADEPVRLASIPVPSTVRLPRMCRLPETAALLFDRSGKRAR